MNPSIPKIGDIVCLKSGGPDMTVCVVSPYNEECLPPQTLCCRWFVNGTICETWVAPDAIRIVIEKGE